MRLTGFAPLLVAATFITPDAGALTAVGIEPVLAESGPVSKTPQTGAITLDGTSSAVGFAIPPGVGSLDFGGVQPPLQTGTGPPAGSVSLSGAIPPLGTTAFPGAGAILSGSDAPTVTEGGDQEITPDVGAADLSSEAPTYSISDHQTATPDTGEIQILPSASVLAKSLHPPSGALAASGEASYLQLGIYPQARGLLASSEAPTVLPSDHKSITPDTGSVQIQADPPSISPAVIPGTGEITASGTQPSLRTGIYPQAGAAAFSGAAPGISQYITVPAGSLSLEGYAGSIEDLDRECTPQVAALDVSGAAPSVAYGANENQSITTKAPREESWDDVFVDDSGYAWARPEGAIVLRGYAPVVVSGALRPAAGALSLDGQAPTVHALGLTHPSAGSMGFAGNAPTLSVSLGESRQITTGTPRAETWDGLFVDDAGFAWAEPEGALTLRGHQPTVLVGPGPVTRYPQTGQLAATGNYPTIARAGEITPPCGSLSAVGQVPHFPTDTEITPPSGEMFFGTVWQALRPSAGSVGFSGNAPVLAIGLPSASVEVTPPVGAASVTGRQPSVGRGIPTGSGAVSLAGTVVPKLDLGIVPPSGALAADGIAPTYAAPQTRNPGTGTLSIEGEEAIADITSLHEVTVPRGSLSMQAYAPSVLVQLPGFKPVHATNLNTLIGGGSNV